MAERTVHAVSADAQQAHIRRDPLAESDGSASEIGRQIGRLPSSSAICSEPAHPRASASETLRIVPCVLLWFDSPMSCLNIRRFRVPTLALLIGGLPAAAAMAEDAGGENIEELVVVARTGSHIKRQAELPSPLAGYDSEALRSSAAKDIRDLIGTLPINNGAENNSDNLTQNYTAGTANVNLRGLGVASTLVLLNGKRQVFSAVQTDDGASFVDLAALVPLLAVQRVEILKDGASAIYGSDAVAGVANFITKRDYEGAEVQAEYRKRTGNGTQRDLNIDGVAGATFGDRGSFLIGRAI